jgi:hypothetical protein
MWVAHNHAAHSDKATYTYPFDITPYRVLILTGFYAKAPDDCTIAVNLGGPRDTYIQCDWVWFNPITRQTHTARYTISLIQDKATLFEMCRHSGELLAEQVKHTKRQALKEAHARFPAF